MVLRGQPLVDHDLGGALNDLHGAGFRSSGALWDLSANLPGIPGVSEVVARGISGHKLLLISAATSMPPILSEFVRPISA